MAVRDDSPHFAEYIGVPCYYVTEILREDAGDGNVRIWNCITRRGVLIPSCEIIVPALRLLQIGKDASAFAADLCQRQTILHAGMRH